MSSQRKRRKQGLLKAHPWRLARQAVQFLLLAVFVYFFVAMMRGATSPLLANLFSRLDPLIAVVPVVAAREIIVPLLIAAAVILLTLAVGRVWCGWICPVGTILDLFGPHARDFIPDGMRRVKYFLLFTVLFLAILGSLTYMYLDPITVLIRGMVAAVAPAISLWLGVPVVLILLLNFVERRFWCRYMCPLGAGVGLIARFAWLRRRVGEDCVGCGLCSRGCLMDAIEEEGYGCHPSECTMCMECLEACPVGGISFSGGWGTLAPSDYDPSRRELIASGATALATFGLTRVGVLRSYGPFFLRPPGAEEDDFLAKCVRCGQCLAVCPNHSLKPASLEAGLEGIWTPVFVPRAGGCDYDCNACGQICPTGAIPSLSLAEKRIAVIGTAYVFREPCISCMLCIDECPTGALVEVEVEGTMYPQVKPDLCIGCGICEHICPVEDEVAIRVYAVDRRPARPAPVPTPTPAPTHTPSPQPTAEPGETPTVEPTPSLTPSATPPQASDKRAHVIREECIRCMICVKECPDEAIEKVMIDDVEYPRVVVEKCNGCGVCEEVCPTDPKAIKLFDPEDLPDS